MHHWTLSIPAATCRAPDQIHIWQHLFPRIGFEHPFVNSAILGSAALHLAHLSPPGPAREAYVTRATLHHNAGLNGFQRSIVTISPSNSEALFVWSILNILYIFGISTYNLAGVLSRKDLVLGVEWIPMLKGISAVLKPIYSDLLVGRMMSIVNIGNFSDLDPGPLATQGVDGLLCNIRDTWKHLSNAPIYDECLCSLRRCRMFMDQFDNMGPAALAESGYHRAWSGPFIFIFVVPEAYFTLLHQRQPPALVLFAFYGALMHMVRDFWFIGGLGKEIVEVVDDLIGPYWRPYITWPLEFVDSAQ